jgi:hypothetical protein
VSRVDTSVLFLLFLGLLVFQLDRMNLASALTGGFAKDINVKQDTINLGNQLMFMGIVVLEIPCNMALQRVRTPFCSRRYWIWMLISIGRLALGNGYQDRCFSSGLLLPCKSLSRTGVASWLHA